MSRGLGPFATCEVLVNKEWQFINLKKIYANSHPAVVATVLSIAITDIHFANGSTNPTNNLVQVSYCDGLKTIKSVVGKTANVIQLCI